MSSSRNRYFGLLLAVAGIATAVSTSGADPQPAKKLIRLRGTVIDAESGKPIPARVYIQGEDGTWLIVKSDDPKGSVVTYRKQVGASPQSIDIHTTVSAHPFFVDVSAGKYSISVERGKEYHPLGQQVTVGAEPVEVQLKLERWTDL